jgi:hypothetical protein
LSLLTGGLEQAVPYGNQIHLDPYAFNLTALVTPDDGQTENLGFLIGSRSVDRFSIVQIDWSNTL